LANGRFQPHLHTVVPKLFQIPTPQHRRLLFKAPTFSSGDPDSQLETLDEPENLLGGIDVTAAAVGRPDLFGPAGRTDPTVWTAAELAQAENNVYRSLIVPPPNKSTVGVSPVGAEYPTPPLPLPMIPSSASSAPTINPTCVITVDGATVAFTKINPLNGVSTDATAFFNPLGQLSAPPPQPISMTASPRFGQNPFTMFAKATLSPCSNWISVF